MKHFYTAMLIVFISQVVPCSAAAPGTAGDGFILRIVSDTAATRSREVFVSSTALQALEQSRVTLQGKPENPVRTWIGASLAAVLGSHGVETAAVRRLSVTAADGYMAVIEGELLPGIETAICATGIQGERVFPEKYGYMRLIFPDLRPMYWTNNPVKIEVFLGVPEPTPMNMDLYFPESTRLNHFFGGKRIIPLADLLGAAGASFEHFSVLAADTLLRPYDSNTIIKFMVLLAEAGGRYSVGGVNVPAGLKTSGVFCITADTSMIFLKQLTVEERDLWSDLLWRGSEPLNDSAAPAVLRMLKNGRIMLTRRVKGTGREIYDCAVGMIMQHPDFDCIRVRGE